MVAQAAGPGAATVGIFAIIEIERVGAVENVIGIAHEFPVHQVFRFHDGYTRVHVHRCAAHVIGVAHTDHRQVGHISMNDWIDGFLGVGGRQTAYRKGQC